MKFHVIMACHNRREASLNAVKSMQAAAKKAGANIAFTAFDDGSNDGTALALETAVPTITILHGDGSAFWAKSMATAEENVLAEAEEGDWIVWLNDDVVLSSDVFEVFFEWAALMEHESVAVGAMADPATGVRTYGGLTKCGVHPLRFEAVAVSDRPTPIDSFNGNLVFVPFNVAKRVAGIDGAYSHALADIDYGLRCLTLGVPLYQLPGILGTCARNPSDGTQGAIQDWKRFTGTKGGGNYASLRRILKKTAGRSWPIFLGSTYVLWGFRWSLRYLKSRISMN